MNVLIPISFGVLFVLAWLREQHHKNVQLHYRIRFLEVRDELFRKVVEHGVNPANPSYLHLEKMITDKAEFLSRQTIWSTVWVFISQGRKVKGSVWLKSFHEDLKKDPYLRKAYGDFNMLMQEMLFEKHKFTVQAFFLPLKGLHKLIRLFRKGKNVTAPEVRKPQLKVTTGMFL